MEDSWKFYTEIDFSNEKIKQFHVDTRDFHCSVNEDNPKKELIGMSKVKFHPDKYAHTGEEVMQLLTRLFNESGGKAKWRFLMLDTVGDNWSLKYIRIYRTYFGLVVCDSQNNVLTKEVLNSKVNQEYLHSH